MRIHAPEWREHAHSCPGMEGAGAFRLLNKAPRFNPALAAGLFRTIPRANTTMLTDRREQEPSASQTEGAGAFMPLKRAPPKAGLQMG